MARKLFAIALFALLGTAGSRAANTTATLLLDHVQARPGDTVMAAVRLKMDPGWHTYWENPGDSGYATKIKWTLPPGTTNGAIQWPVPEKVVISGETTFGYHDEAVLLVPIQILANAPSGPAKLSAKVSWLECEKLCIPGSATVAAELVIGTGSQPASDPAVFTDAQARLPRASGAEAHAFWADSNPTNRTLVVEWKTTAVGADFFPKTTDGVTVSAKSASGQNGPDSRQIRFAVSLDATSWPKQIAGVLAEDAHGSKAAGYAVTLPIEEAKASAVAGGSPTDAAAPSAPLGFNALIVQLALGFLGGLILNVMPCVLPVIALKILGVVGQNRSDPHRVRLHGVAYGAGVVLSFVVMAVAVVGFRSVGIKLLWGSQFGSPVFLVVLTALMVLVALSLFGVFEITLSGNVMNAATRASSAATEFFSKAAGGWGAAKTDRASADGGLADSFFNGVFATIMGVSCTAPVLGAAVGFALTQQAFVVFLMFICVGAGLATPYVLLCMQPAWLKFLPKPGRWMEKFKVAMGFPMLATGIWIFTVAAGIFPGRELWLGLFLVILSAAAWVYGEFIQRSLSRHGIAWTSFAILLAVGYGYVLEKELDWRHPPTKSGTMHNDPEGIAWQQWSLDAVAKAQAEGRPVLVDFTADWCINCQVNKRNSIEVPETQAKLKEINAVALLADYTRTPSEMSDEILAHGRAGVPLVLVYPGKPGAKPQILPELFTKGMMIEALDRAIAGPKSN